MNRIYAHDQTRALLLAMGIPSRILVPSFDIVIKKLVYTISIGIDPCYAVSVQWIEGKSYGLALLLHSPSCPFITHGQVHHNKVGGFSSDGYFTFVPHYNNMKKRT